MDWRRKRLLNRSQRPMPARTPRLVYEQARANLRAAARSSDARARHALSASLAEVNRVLDSEQALDETESLSWLLKRIWSDLLWMDTALRFAAGEVTARDAMLSLAARTQRRRPRVLPGAEPRPRFELAAGIGVALRMKPIASLWFEESSTESFDEVEIAESRAVAILRTLVRDKSRFDSAEATQNFLQGQDVEEFAAALAYLGRDLNSRLEWESLASAAVTAMSPAVGFALASTIQARMPWLPASDHRHTSRTTAGVLRTVERAMVQMLRPELPYAYRRLLANFVGGISSEVLDAQDNDEYSTGNSVRPSVRLYWSDLFCSSAFRADATFYGRGAVGVTDDSEGDEAEWRSAIYRLRHRLDSEAWLEKCATELELHPPVWQKEERDAIAQRFIDAYLAREQKLTAEALAAAYDDLCRRAHLGRTHGWVAPVTALATSPEELERWLLATPRVAALTSTGLGYWYLTFSDGSSLIEILLADQHGASSPDEDPGSDIDALEWYHDRLGRAIQGRPSREGERLVLEEELSAMLQAPELAAIGRRLADQVRRHGLTTLLVLSSDEQRSWPWEGIVLDDSGTTLAELVSIVHVHTLLPVAARDSVIRPGTLVCMDGTDFFKFLELCQPRGVLRLLGSERLDDPFAAANILGLDLTGCGRVELWSDPVMLPIEGCHAGLETCFQLAGAHVVIGCPWRVPETAARLIAVTFSLEARTPGSADSDASILARVIRKYREAVAVGGVVERKIRSALVSEIGKSEAVSEDAIARILRESSGSALGSNDGDDSPVAEQPAPEGAELLVGRVMGPLRDRSAWAGWRVFCRDPRRLCSDKPDASAPGAV